MYPFELVGCQLNGFGSPARARLPRLAGPWQGPNPLDSCFRSAPDNLSDLNVPMLSLGVLGLDDFAQVRWGPEID